jgi:hypothetical protein
MGGINMHNRIPAGLTDPSLSIATAKGCKNTNGGQYMKSKLYTMLTPILKAKDLDAEVAFYLLLGFELSYNGEDFKAITYADCIEFGLSRKADVKGFVSKMKIVLVMKNCLFLVFPAR